MSKSPIPFPPFLAKRLAPSPRTPELSTWLNNADNIDRYLQEDGHQIWGIVIYRCTFRSNSDWEECVRRIRDRASESLKYYNGLDLMQRFRPIVFDDRAKFEGASTAAVREHFRQWTATAPQEEQGTGPGLSHRYRYCIYVDDEALRSVIDADPKSITDGFVKLIHKDWEPELDNDDEQKLLEGCTQEDVGWMMVGYQDVMVDMYPPLRDEDAWSIEYKRPDWVVHG